MNKDRQNKLKVMLQSNPAGTEALLELFDEVLTESGKLKSSTLEGAMNQVNMNLFHQAVAYHKSGLLIKNMKDKIERLKNG